MAAIPNTITTQQFSINPREVDFVTSFGREITALTEVMGISRPIRKPNGTMLTAKKATGELQSGSVAEGDLIPLSQHSSTLLSRRIASLIASWSAGTGIWSKISPQISSVPVPYCGTPAL